MTNLPHMLLGIWPYKLFAFSVFVVQDLSISALCLFGSKVPGICELSFPLYLFLFFFLPLFFNPSFSHLWFRKADVFRSCQCRGCSSASWWLIGPVLNLVVFLRPLPLLCFISFSPQQHSGFQTECLCLCCGFKNTSNLDVLGVLEREKEWLRAFVFLLFSDRVWISLNSHGNFPWEREQLSQGTAFPGCLEVRPWELAQLFTCTTNATVRISLIIFTLGFRLQKMFIQFKKKKKRDRK